MFHLVDIEKIMFSNIGEYIFFSSTQTTVIKTNYVVGHSLKGQELNILVFAGHIV